MRYFRFIIFLLMVVIIISCSKKKTTSNPFDDMTDNEILTNGWSLIFNEEYSNAEDYFLELLNREVMLSEANLGLAWVEMKSAFIDIAIEKLDIALSYNPNSQTSSDINATMVLCLDSQNDFAACIAKANEIDSDWIFSYDQEFNYTDIILVKAVAYYALGDFDNSLSQVQIIEPDFDANVQTVDGRTLLAEKIEELISLN